MYFPPEPKTDTTQQHNWKKGLPAHAKRVYQKEKEISVLVFVQIDLIQIEC
jgi:hypothetical protein